MADLNPTERLYFDDAFLRSFDARVVALVDFDGQPAAVLDATALYPEGGGQPADRGTLAGVTVRDVQEHADVIYHILAEPLPASVGDRVEATIDWQRRFDHMQQHTGQHTLSGAFYRLAGAETLSWHLSADVVTVDIGRAGLSEGALAEIEQAANEILWADLPVTAKTYSREDLAKLALRKGSDREGMIRVVHIGDWDAIGCGGTHVARAGQVGAIGLRRAETRGQMTRVEFVCGARALADYHAKTATLGAVGGMLSARLDEIRPQLDRLMQQHDAQRHAIADLKQQLAAYEARDLIARADARAADRPLVVAALPERSPDDLRLLAQRIAESGGVALLGSVVDGKAFLAFACDREAALDLNQALRAALPLIGGKGGGQKFQAQGGGPEIAGLPAALDHARSLLAS
jgi:alanyl-tRNA synthetase